MHDKFNIISKNVIRQDGLEKVTGQAKFADDINFPNQLFGVMVRVPVAHAEIKSIDYSQIENHPAIETICDSYDIIGAKKVGAIKQDQPIFAFDKIRSQGDVVCMLVGESENELLKLRNKIHIEYTELPALSDPLNSLEKDAPIIHEQFENNLINHYPLRKGDVAKGFEESDHIIEQTYTTPHIEHAYIEPEAVIAVPKEGNKGIHIIGSIQNPFTTRKVVAAVLGWQMAKVRIEQAELGGSFGGKDDTMNVLSARAAIAAIKTGRPVKIRYSREDSILESYKRHPYVLNYKVGFNSDGKLKAMKIDITADGGAYASMSPFVTWRSVVQATGPYEIENVWTDVRAVYTNNPYTGAFRGFGSPQIIFAQESLMDEIAEICGITPLEIRKINGFKQGSITASGQKLSEHKVSLHQVIKEAVEKSNYKKKYEQYKKSNAVSRRYKYGIGLSCSYRGCSLGAEGTDASSAIVSVQADGSVIVFTGVNENGQGLRTTMCQVASEVLGVSLDDITFLEPQTSTITDGGPTVASRGTIVGGNATIQAANIIKTRIFEIIKDDLKVSRLEETEWKNGYIYRKAKNPKIKPVKFSEAAEKAYWDGVNLSAYGWFNGPDVNWDEETGQGNAYFTYVYGCHIVETLIDTHIGKIDMEKITAADVSSKVGSPMLFAPNGPLISGFSIRIGSIFLMSLIVGIRYSSRFNDLTSPF